MQPIDIDRKPREAEGHMETQILLSHDKNSSPSLKEACLRATEAGTKPPASSRKEVKAPVLSSSKPLPSIVRRTEVASWLPPASHDPLKVNKLFGILQVSLPHIFC